MKHTRRDVLRKASALGAAVIGASGVSAAADCDGVAEWKSNGTYTSGDQVVDDGSLWEAEWWTRGDEPGADEWGPWAEVGVCSGDDGGDTGDDDGGGNNGDEEDDVDDSDAGKGADCRGVVEWDAEATYTDGDRTVYEGSLWEAEWWTRGDEPGSSEWGPWEAVGSCTPMPDASFRVSSRRLDPGETVRMDMTASENWDTYEWTLDGEPMDWGETPEHTVSEAGRYSVALTVTDADGNTDSTTKTISVGTMSSPIDGGIYSPYQGTWYDVVEDTLETDTDRVILSFVGDATRDGEIDPGWLSGCNAGSCDESPLSAQADAIRTLQDEGIEVGISIGGWHSPVVARDASDATELKEAYATILDTFGINHLDIDDENADQRDRTVYEMRNEALAMLNDERPDLTVGFTVSCTADGIVSHGHSHGKTWVKDAAEKGVDLDYVQPMTMNFVSSFADIPPALESTVDFLSGDVYPGTTRDEVWSMVGVTPNINELSIQDARNLLEYAEEKGMYSIAPWVLGDDENGEFSAIFHQFESE
ncbi:carbohydrate-binding protein [Halorhabdus sp. BNX81]|uniref:carbohydrate-binding protein n=1 Tax=Halorhabdus sp. BNX81 TaxID=2980181 RepID=UPI0023DD204C|nr:carbohydrate-binding protein [Halorhabdus sp. BNX81]WEL21250.1 Chitinase, glycosyl hydrolase family 18 [Halorhabdus sp. BNX81]